MTVRRWVVALACATFFVAAACGSDPEGAGGGDSGAVEVTAANFAFTPVLISVEAGSQVELTFTNDDDTQHSFTSDALAVDLAVDGGSSDSTTFTAPDSGVAEFHCKFHPTMTGTIATNGSGAGSGGSEDPGEEDAGGDTGDDLDY